MNGELMIVQNGLSRPRPLGNSRAGGGGLSRLKLALNMKYSQPVGYIGAEVDECEYRRALVLSSRWSEHFRRMGDQ